MAQEVKANLYNPTAKVAIICAEFNHFITDSLVKGAVSTLVHTGGLKDDEVKVYKVPGAYEIPLVVKLLAEKGEVDAVVCLGAVVRGATPHFDYVCGPMASEIMKLSTTYSLPVGFGVLTTNDLDEAFERCGTKAGNKGAEAAHVALEMLNLKNLI